MKTSSVRLPVKVLPGAKSEGIAGWMGESLRIRVAAPPERGKANASVVKIIESTLGLGSGSVRILNGKTSPRKVVEISGLTEEEIYERLSPSINTRGKGGLGE